MRLTIRTNLAARVLMFCAANRDRLVRTAEIAKGCNASPSHVARVVNQLQTAEFVETLRGRGGGLRLARPLSEISIGAVFRSFEQDIPFAECFDAEINTCPLTSACRLKEHIRRAVEAFYGELDAVTLQDLTATNTQLEEILAIAPALPKTCTPA